MLDIKELQRKNSHGGGGIRPPLSSLDTLLQNTDKNTIEITQDFTKTNFHKNSKNGNLKQKFTLGIHFFAQNVCHMHATRIGRDNRKMEQVAQSY